jgi:butyrate kinase
MENRYDFTETLHKLVNETNDIKESELEFINKELKDMKRIIEKISLNQSDTLRFIMEFCIEMKKDNDLLRSIIKITEKGKVCLNEN